MKTIRVKNDQELHAAIDGEPVNIVIPKDVEVGDIYIPKNVRVGYIDVHGTSGSIHVEGTATDVFVHDGAIVDDTTIHTPTANDIEFLKSIPLDSINMGYWHSSVYWEIDLGKLPNECGMPHCIGGYAQCKHNEGLSPMETMHKHYPNLVWLCYLVGGDLAKRTIERLIREFEGGN